MAKPSPRIVEVIGSTRITPNMLRVTLGGASMHDFPPGHEGGYIKLMFPDAFRVNPDRPVMRTYSVRAHNEDRATIDVDFALHGETGGIATDWAVNARPGDKITMSGPGSVKMAPQNADWVLLAGDMTGLPALLCNIERLPPHARGYIVMELTSEADKPDMTLPDGVEFHEVITPNPTRAEGRLAEKIRALPWMEGKPSVWTACEFDTMRELRSYYRTERAVARDAFYLSSYWRAGCTEDQHKVAKQRDTSATAA